MTEIALTFDQRAYLRRARDLAMRDALEARFGVNWRLHISSATALLEKHVASLLNDDPFWAEYEDQLHERLGDDEAPTASDRIRAARERTS